MAVNSIVDVLQHVKTPLALAALVFLLGAPLLRQVLARKGRPNDDTKAIIRYGFILGVVWGVWRSYPSCILPALHARFV